MFSRRRGVSNRKEKCHERTEGLSTIARPQGSSSMISFSEKEIHGQLMRVRILIVDDNAPVREGLRRLLEDHDDWEVCGEATNGLEAIEKYRVLRPDLLIVDVSMPVMNGLDASNEILKLCPDILILLYTSYLTLQLIEDAHKAGIRRTVSKDSMHLVVTGLEALLRGEEFSGPANCRPIGRAFPLVLGINTYRLSNSY